MFENSYFTKPEHIFISSLYVLATIICLLASCLVWVIVLTRQELRSPMNYLLLNLSLSDMVSSISVYPYLFITDPEAISKSRKAQSNLCMVTEGLTPFFIASAASLLTLCAISFNRFLAIKYPTKQTLRMGRRSVLVFSIFAWSVGLSCMLPGMVSFKWDPHFKICGRDWHSMNSIVYRLFIMCLGLLLPTTFLLLSYSAIFCKAREIMPFEHANPHALWRRRMRMRKAERMLGLLIVIYILCWFPFILYWTIASVTNYFAENTASGTRNGQRWLRVTVLFCTLNGTFNPFIYTLGSNDLKRDMTRVTVVIFRKITCRSAFPVHPLPTRRTASIRSNLTVAKRLSSKTIVVGP